MAKTHAFGTEFSWNGETVAGLNAINGIEITAETVDVTTHDSEGAFREFLTGFLDAGEVSLEGFFDPEDTTGQQAMLASSLAREIKQCIITFPASTGATWTFDGLITAIKIGDAPVDNAIPFSATIKPSGQPVFATATATGLSDMTMTGATLVPAFAAATLEYIATAEAETATVKVTPTADGVIKVNGNTVATGQASGDITLGAAGTITVINIEVTEPNTAAKKYTISVARAAAE